MTTQALPGGYRVQIVRRTDETPPEIKGEWAVHCTLCKWVRWMATHDEALRVAHYDHPSGDVHQKWIGRVLVGRQPSPLRGYHARQGEASLASGHREDEADFRYPTWTPAAIPTWVVRQRHLERCGQYKEQDELSRRRQAAQTRVPPPPVELHYSHQGSLVINGAAKQPATAYELRVGYTKVGEVSITHTGEWAFNGRLFSGKVEASPAILAHASKCLRA